MTTRLEQVAKRRSDELKKRLKRLKLVFVQCGRSFDILQEPLLAGIGGKVADVHDFVKRSEAGEKYEIGTIVLVGIERFAATGESLGITLGQVREQVDLILEEGAEICLLSRQPRIAFQAVVGSSIIEDAAVYLIPTLDDSEVEPGVRADQPVRILPTFGLSVDDDSESGFSETVNELGVEMLASLDHAIFVSGLGRNFLSVMDSREVEALRGAGLVYIAGGTPQFALARYFSEFINVVSDVLANAVAPPAQLALISSGIWEIERTIRLRLRQASMDGFGGRWKRNVVHGDLQSKILEKARGEANVAASGLSDLRDPTEWLSLGELLEVVENNTFNGLGLDELFWRRFKLDVLPIRNRLSHMRLFKKGDSETVMMWQAQIRRLVKP